MLRSQGRKGCLHVLYLSKSKFCVYHDCMKGTTDWNFHVLTMADLLTNSNYN